MEDFLLHFSIRLYLRRPGERYHVTDVSTGAMLGKSARLARTERYDRWHALLQDEIELVAPRAEVFAVGSDVAQHLERHGFPRPFSRLIHYSRLAGSARLEGFDFALQQISSLPERAQGVDFSEGYYDVDQALVSVRGSSIAGATSLEERKDATLGAPIGTTSLNVIEDTIQPATRTAVYDDLSAAVEDLKNGHVDGIVVDLPSASFITDAQGPESVVVGRFPSVGSQEHLAMAFEKGSSFVECVNLALQEMKDDGTLDAIRQTWLPDTADVPSIED